MKLLICLGITQNVQHFFITASNRSFPPQKKKKTDETSSIGLAGYYSDRMESWGLYEICESDLPYIGMTKKNLKVNTRNIQKVLQHPSKTNILTDTSKKLNY